MVVSAANLNSPEQTVISGHAAAVKRAVELASQEGAKRAVILAVSAPFHCALMQPTQARMEPELRAVNFSDLKIPLVTNVDAEIITERQGGARRAHTADYAAGALGRVDPRID